MSSTDQNAAHRIEAIGAVEETSTDHVSGGSRATRTAPAKERGVYRGRARRLDGAAVVEVRRPVGEGVPEARIARDPGCSRRVICDALAATGARAAVAPVADGG